MHTHYIGPMLADINDQSASRKVELRAEPSEAHPGRLGLSVNSYSSGKELVLVHLTAQQVAELADALREWKEE